MNFATLLPFIIKYAPLILGFIQTQGPGLHTFIQEVETAIKGAKNADGSINWVELLPVLFKYAPQLLTFFQTQGVPFQTLVSDFMAILKGQTVTSTGPVPVPTISASGAVNQGPGFQFPPQA